MKLLIKSYLMFFLPLSSLAWCSDIKEISINALYKTGIIDRTKLLTDDTFYLKFCKSKEHIVYLKRGRDNHPFSIDLHTYNIVTASTSDWNNAPNILTAPYYSTGHFLNKGSELLNIYSRTCIRPSGDHILYFCSNVDGKYIFIYSFSGLLRKSKGIGFWITSSEKKIGMNCLEIWNTQSQKIEFVFKKFSFSNAYRPQLLFWIENFRLIILSNNHNKSLIFLKY